MKLLFAKTAEGVKFYPITIAEGVIYKPANGSAMKLNEFLDSIDYSGKADKVSGATSGNFAGLDSNGNLTDSGSKAADFKTKQTAVSNVAGSSTKTLKSLSQNANGEISYEMQDIPEATQSAAGLMSAADKTKLDGVDYSGKADKVASATNGNFAGLDANGNLTDSGSKASDFDAAGAAATAEQNAKDYADGLIDDLGGSASQDAADANGNIAASVTSEKGEVKTISVDASALKAAAASDATTKANAAQAAAEATAAADATSKANQAKADVIGTASDVASDDTIKGAKKYADGLAADIRSEILAGKAYQGTVADASGLPSTLTADDAGKYYIITGNGKFAYWNGTSWDYVDQETSVVNDNTDLVIGTAVKVATVEGVAINVKQVEDMTKIEAEACGDTTDYPDYSSLFTTPSAGE